jgi:hypothetical protein
MLKCHHVEGLQWLVKTGQLALTQERAQEAVHFGATVGSIRIIKWLLREQDAVAIAPEILQCAMYTAIECGNICLVKYLDMYKYVSFAQAQADGRFPIHVFLDSSTPPFGIMALKSRPYWDLTSFRLLDLLAYFAKGSIDLPSVSKEKRTIIFNRDADVNWELVDGRGFSVLDHALRSRNVVFVRRALEIQRERNRSKKLEEVIRRVRSSVLSLREIIAIIGEDDVHDVISLMKDQSNHAWKLLEWVQKSKYFESGVLPALHPNSEPGIISLGAQLR